MVLTLEQMGQDQVPGGVSVPLLASRTRCKFPDYVLITIRIYSELMQSVVKLMNDLFFLFSILFMIS